MKHLFAIMIMAFVALWGFSISSDVQAGNVCPSGSGCPTNNWCCPEVGGCGGVPQGARCGNDAAAQNGLNNGGCCLDGTFLPGAPCDCNQPPDCSNAAADLDYLWPPNHNFAEVWVIGVTDPDGDPVTITIDGIFQDEATETALGAGDFCPDAIGVGTGYASVRAERSGNKNIPGDGRVYSIEFTADDGLGGECQGTVTVCIPHDKSDTSCVDGGPLYNSTVCN